jgi:hypothetical protein
MYLYHSRQLFVNTFIGKRNSIFPFSQSSKPDIPTFHHAIIPINCERSELSFYFEQFGEQASLQSKTRTLFDENNGR